MIVDKWENILFYESMIKNLKNGVNAVNSLANLEVGKYEFDGGFFMVQKGETQPMDEGTFEAHKKYIDVQIIMEGSEDVAWADTSDLQVDVPYNEEKDAMRLSGQVSHWMHMTAGMCYVAYPWDGHKPVRHVEKPQSFTKIVLKLPVL